MRAKTKLVMSSMLLASATSFAEEATKPSQDMWGRSLEEVEAYKAAQPDRISPPEPIKRPTKSVSTEPKELPTKDIWGRSLDEPAAEASVSSAPPSKKKLRTTRELYKKAFGVDLPDTKYPYRLRVIAGDQTYNSVEVMMNPLTIEYDLSKGATEEITQVLRAILTDEAKVQVLGADPKAPVSQSALDANNITLLPNREALTLEIQVPPSLLERVELRSGNRTFADANVEPKEQLSGYVNLFSDNTYLDTGDRRLTNLHRVESSVGYNGIIAQHEGRYQNFVESSEWVNEGARLVVPDPKHRQHIIVGDQEPQYVSWDLNPNPMASLFNDSLMGVGVNQRLFMGNARSNQSGFDYAFELEERTTVNIYVNGDAKFQQTLEPGKYEITDIETEFGFNDIRVDFSGESGTFQQYEDIYYRAYDFLAEGQSEYQVAVGYPYEIIDDMESIDYSELSFIGYYRYGITEKLSLGPYVQFQDDLNLIGLISQLGTPVGELTVDLVTSDDKTVGRGYAFESELTSNTGFRPFGDTSTSYLSYGVGFDGYNKEFVNTSATRTDFLETTEDFRTAQTRWRVRPFMTIGFSQNSRLRLDTEWTNLRGENGGTVKNHSVEYAHRIGQFELRAEYIYREFVNNVDVDGFLLSVYWDGTRGLRRAELTYDTIQDQSTYLGTQRDSSDSLLNYTLEGEYSNSDNQQHEIRREYFNGDDENELAYRYNVRAGSKIDEFRGSYGTSRGLINAQYNSVRKGVDSATFDIETGIAFVGNKVGITRPVEDSFALLYGAESLEGGSVQLTRGATIDWMGPAVVQNLASYQENELYIDSHDLPIGTNLGEGQYVVSNPYASGVSIKVGGDANYSAVGRLIDEDGKPVELATGFATPEGGSSKERKFFFSSQKGQFSLSGLEQGTWELKLNKVSHEPIFIDVKKSEDGSMLIMLEDQVVKVKRGLGNE